MKIVPLLISASLLLAGCASIVSKSTYPVSIQSSKAGTSYKILDENGAVISAGRAPALVRLDASNGFFDRADYTVVFQNNGRVTRRSLQARIDPWVIGNVFFGGFIGLAIDGATGAMFKLPKTVEGYVSGPRYSSVDAGEFIIARVEDLTPQQRMHMVPVQ